MSRRGAAIMLEHLKTLNNLSEQTRHGKAANLATKSFNFNYLLEMTPQITTDS
jgi:hypothetical protein